MTFTVTLDYVKVMDKGWKARVSLGSGGYKAFAKYENKELIFRSDKNSIKNEPVSWDTILEKVEEMVDGVTIPDVETGKYGQIEE